LPIRHGLPHYVITHYRYLLTLRTQSHSITALHTQAKYFISITAVNKITLFNIVSLFHQYRSVSLLPSIQVFTTHINVAFITSSYIAITEPIARHKTQVLLSITAQDISAKDTDMHTSIGYRITLFAAHKTRYFTHYYHYRITTSITDYCQRHKYLSQDTSISRYHCYYQHYHLLAYCYYRYHQFQLLPCYYLFAVRHIVSITRSLIGRYFSTCHLSRYHVITRERVESIEHRA
jgi:hypothetical protein